MRRSFPLKHFLTFSVLIMLLAVFVPLLGSTGGSVDERTVLDLEFSFQVEMDEGIASLVDARVRTDGEALIGLSSGEDLEIVIDPTPGSPELPWIATVINIHGDILNARSDLNGEKHVPLPAPLRTVPRPTTPWEEEVPWGAWSGEGSYPDEQVMVQSLGYRRIDGMLMHSYSIWFTPFHLEGGTLTYSADPEVEVEYTEEMSGPAPTRITGDPEAVPGTLSISPSLEVRPQYLIITSKDSVDELDVLAQWRNGMGVATSVIAVEDILENYEGSEDPADLVRDYIKDVLDTWGTLQHVLLAGDWETVPVKRVVDSEAYGGWDDGYIPADTYFQCLDGTWDLDGDGLYAEPGDMEDIIPDISLSRLAIDDPVVWRDKISQLISYESDRSRTDWTSTALLVAANTHNYGDGSIHSEYLWDKYLNETYEEKLPLYEDEGTLTLSAVDEALESGVSFVQFVDHGGPTVWCDDYGAGVVYRDRDARELTNGNRLSVISTLACLTNWFDDTSGCQYQRFSEGLGEAFTENVNGGGLGYIGSSRTSVGILGANRYLPYDNGLQEDIARQIGGLQEYTLGSIFTEGKGHYAEVWGQQFPGGNREVAMCWLEFTLLGEPAVEIWTGERGEMELEVHHEDDLDPHIQIAVTDGYGSPLPDANVTLQNFERCVFARGITNGEGVVTFDIVLDWFCDINLTVTKHNYNQIRDYIRISDIIPPVTSVVTDPPEPGGRNGWFLTEPVIRLVPNEKAVVHYRIGPGGPGILNGSGNFTLPELGEGFHQVHFFSEDSAGNFEEEMHTEFRIDLSAPNLTVSLSPEGPDGDHGWYGTEPLVTISTAGPDPGSPVDIFYTLEGELLEYDGPFFVPEGKHSIPVFGVDQAGRISNTTYIDLKIDTTPPTTSIKVSRDEPDGSNGWYISSPLVELTSSEGDAVVEYRFSAREKFIQYTGPFHVEDGDRLLQYRSVDLSGNIGPTESLPVRVDTRGPTVAVSLSPSEPDGMEGFYVTSPVMRIEWYDNIGSTLHFEMDGTDIRTDVNRFEVPDGIHEISVHASDEAGNSCPVQTFQFRVDTRAPVASIDVREPGPLGWYTSTPLIGLSTDIDSQIVYWWEGKGEVATYQRPLDVPAREGIFTLHYFSRDLAGNEGPEEERTFKVDTKEPILRLETLEQGRSSFLIDCTGSTDGTELEFRVMEGGSVLVDWTDDGNIELELPDGSHRVLVEARDEAGNTVSSEIVLEVQPAWMPFLVYGLPAVIAAAAILAVFVYAARRKHHFEENLLPAAGQEGYHAVEAVEVLER
ncbi:MAG: C25 family cysteine peptidase [Thermoplasmatota archaeon]